MRLTAAPNELCARLRFCSECDHRRIASSLVVFEALGVHLPNARYAVSLLGDNRVAQIDLFDGHLIERIGIGGVDRHDMDGMHAYRQVTPTRRLLWRAAARSVEDLWRIFRRFGTPTGYASGTKG